MWPAVAQSLPPRFFFLRPYIHSDETAFRDEDSLRRDDVHAFVMGSCIIHLPSYLELKVFWREVSENFSAKLDFWKSLSFIYVVFVFKYWITCISSQRCFLQPSVKFARGIVVSKCWRRQCSRGKCGKRKNVLVLAQSVNIYFDICSMYAWLDTVMANWPFVHSAYTIKHFLHNLTSRSRYLEDPSHSFLNIRHVPV